MFEILGGPESTPAPLRWNQAENRDIQPLLFPGTHLAMFGKFALFGFIRTVCRARPICTQVDTAGP